MTRKEIQNILDDLHLTYKVDDDGDLMIFLSADDDYGYNVGIFINCECDGDVIKMLGGSGQHFSKDKHGEMIVFCNKWNAEKRWPKAYVIEQGDGNLDVRCEIQVNGVKHSVSDDFIKENITSMT